MFPIHLPEVGCIARRHASSHGGLSAPLEKATTPHFGWDPMIPDRTNWMDLLRWIHPPPGTPAWPGSICRGRVGCSSYVLRTEPSFVKGPSVLRTSKQHRRRRANSRHGSWLELDGRTPRLAQRISSGPPIPQGQSLRQTHLAPISPSGKAKAAGRGQGSLAIEPCASHREWPSPSGPFRNSPYNIPRIALAPLE